MEEIRAGHGVLNVQANHRDGKKDQDSGRNRARTRWLCIREKEPWKICEGLKGFEDDSGEKELGAEKELVAVGLWQQQKR